MSSSHITLKEFVRPVPTCQQEVTLETLLTLVSSGQHTTIVIVDREHKPRGVFDYRRLLPTVAEHWLNHFTPSVGLERLSGATAPSKQERSGIFTHNLDLDSINEPIVSLSSQMRVESFLSYLKGQEKTKEIFQHYTIVDGQGKLLGLLDIPCLINTLFGNWQNTNTTVLQDQSCSHWLFELLEQTPLPLMLQATEGQALYQNRYWREQVNKIQEFNDSENIAISWSQHQQEQHSSIVNNSNWQPKPEQYPYCLKGNYGLCSSFPSLSQPTITAHSLEILSSLTSEANCDRFSVGQENFNFPVESVGFSTVPSINSQNIWQYIKLPIDWTDYQCLPTNCSGKCWLVLATPNCPTQQFNKEKVTKDGELSELNSLQDSFLARIAHELKSPLTSIVGLSSLLKEQKLGTLNQRQSRYTELIYRSGRQLMNIVNDLLDWNRLATGKLELNLESVKIRAICEEVYQQVLAANRANNICYSKHRFKLNIEPGIDTVVADKLRLGQILTHLLDNAFKFIAPEEEVGISVTLWTKWVTIIVWNNNRSISEVSKSLVLEQFVQSKTSPVESNKELGLVLAQQLARAHGGDISFISKIGKGSEFTLLLPYRGEKCPKRPQNLQSQTQSSSKKKSLTILRLDPGIDTVCANQPITTENSSGDFGLNNDLYNLYHRVIEADSLEQGEILARIWQLDVIILDGSLLTKPLQYLHSLKKYESLAALPLVTLDAKTTEAANQVEGLSVFPCLMPADQRSLADLVQVIQIAAVISHQSRNHKD